ncbi:MAG: 2-oxoadipate dioxygenase/decarboxylase family protein [Phycisphaerales bacterium]
MTHAAFADRTDMQNRLFAELSRMFGEEVPLYDKSLAVNQACNRAVCDLLARLHRGFEITDEQIDRTSGERHGAIRIGRADEYRWIARFFACFGMEPHNFYDMTSVGAKSQPVIATAFRSRANPEHRVFTSLLRTDYFDAQTQQRIETLLAQRQVFSDRAKQLIEKCEQDAGLSESDANALIAEGVQRIFKWTAEARDHDLYKHLCDAGFKIAADIACFGAHHLNHLTPNTFCMDLYTASMKFCLGEIDEPTFRRQATSALDRLQRDADQDFMALHFKHMSREQILALETTTPPEGTAERLIDALVARLSAPDLDLARLPHNGFKDSTEGPAAGTPVLLRQDAYKALTEPVRFTNPDGTEIDTVHTARFGEIEQRFYATTQAGRALYDRCLESAEAEKAADPGLAKQPLEAREAAYARHFEPFPKTLRELLGQELVYGRYEPTAAGMNARGTIDTTDIHELIRRGLVRAEGLRYEDFLPVSAAGIFASNLSQYGTKSTAERKPEYTRQMLEEILDRPIIDSDAAYRAMQADSLLHTYAELGLLDSLQPELRETLERDATACPPGVQRHRATAAGRTH